VKTTDSGASAKSLPVTGDLRTAYVLSLAVALIMGAAALAALLLRSTVYPTDRLILAFVPVDIFHLAIGLPILLGSMWLARRGRLAGLLCWPGVLLYVLYSYVMNLLGVPFGVLFLPYILLVVLSVYSIIVIVSRIDSRAVRDRLAGTAPARVTGGVLVGLTALFVVFAVTGIISALIRRTPVGALQIMLWIGDLATVAPLCLTGGVLLLQRRALGYVAGPGVLLTYTMLFFGLLPVMLYTALYNGTAVDSIGIVMMAAAGLLCLVLLVLFLRKNAS